MSDRSGLSRGDRNRNARLARLRQLLPAENAIVGIDLADDKQAAVVTDHDSRVLARRRVSARAWELGGLLDWAVARAAAAASSGSAPRSADHQRDGAGQSDPGPAGVRLAGGAGRVGLAVPVGELARGGSGGAGPVRG
jgi:hypothetical protein